MRSVPVRLSYRAFVRSLYGHGSPCKPLSKNWLTNYGLAFNLRTYQTTVVTVPVTGAVVIPSVNYGAISISLIARDLRTGSLQWNASMAMPAGFTSRAFATCLILSSDGSLLFATATSSPFVYAFSASTGALVWSFGSFTDTVFSGCAQVDGLGSVFPGEGHNLQQLREGLAWRAMPIRRTVNGRSRREPRT